MKLARIWTDRTEEYRPLLKKAKKLFPSLVDHVPTKSIFMCSFMARNCKHVAMIRPIKQPWKLLVGDDLCYIIEFWENKFDDMDKAMKLFVMLHELVHIPKLGFVEGSREYRQLVDHDLKDFKILRSTYGVDLEKVKRILKGERMLKVREMR